MYQIHKFLSGLGLVECATELASGRDGVLFLNTTHLHAHVSGFNDNHDSKGVQCLFNTLSDLQCHAFLYLETV